MERDPEEKSQVSTIPVIDVRTGKQSDVPLTEKNKKKINESMQKQPGEFD
jgi:hypothetical protein